MLIVGGDFTAVGSLPASHIASFDGANWSTLGAGVSDAVSALATYNYDLIVGGAFTMAGQTPANRIAVWNGATWSALGVGFSADVWALCVYNGDLYAGGLFGRAGDGQTTLNCIAKWTDPSWTPLGTGLSGGANPYRECFALVVYNGELYVGGAFTVAGGLPDTQQIAKWDGSSWSSLGTGNDVTDWVYALSTWTDSAGDTHLVAGGEFGGTQGQNWLGRIGLWDATAWRDLDNGMNGHVHSLRSFGGQLIAGGTFTRAGECDANHIARWQE